MPIKFSAIGEVNTELKDSFEFEANPAGLGPPPRRVRRVWRRSGWTIFGRLLIVPHTIIGIGLAGALVREIGTAAFGANATGSATRVFETKGKGGPRYHVAYRYDTRSGHHSGDITINLIQYYYYSDALGQTLRENRSLPEVTVRFIEVGPWHYGYAIASGDSAWSGIWESAFMACFWNTVVGVFSFLLYVLPHRQRQLFRYGTATEGIVTSKRKESHRGTGYYISYTFCPESSRDFKAEMWVGKREWGTASVGQRVTVLHHTGQSRPSVVYEFAEFTCESTASGVE